MLIPPRNLLHHFAKPDEAVGVAPVRLQGMHLLIAAEVVATTFPDVPNVYIAYKPQAKMLFVVPYTDEMFRKIHEPGQQMLKDRNAKGDKSIPLHELLIDNDLETTDRNLDYQAMPGTLVVRF